MKDRIDAMTHDQLVRLWRFAPIGDPMFMPPYGAYFKARLQDLGGITPEQSKSMGWD
jgi:hypothetical protein